MHEDLDGVEEAEEPEDRGLGIMDVQAHLESVFKGCKVRTPNTVRGVFHAELAFYEYEIRVILQGMRTKDRKFHYRCMQRVEQSGDRRATKRVLQDVEGSSREEFFAAVANTKAHLMGIVYAIHKAMAAPQVARITSIDDLFKGP